MSAGIHAAREATRALLEKPGPKTFITGEVTSVAWPLCTILPADATTAATQLLATLYGIAPAVGDRVLVAFVGGEPVVLGVLARTTPSALTFDAPVVANKGTNSPIFRLYTDNSAVTGSHTSNATYETNIVYSLVLPTGTWTVRAFGVGTYYHAVADTLVDQRMVVDGDPGSLHNMRVGLRADGYTGWACEQEVTGRSGTVDCEIEYKNNASTSTVSAGGGVLFVWAERTS